MTDLSFFNKATIITIIRSMAIRLMSTHCVACKEYSSIIQPISLGRSAPPIPPNATIKLVVRSVIPGIRSLAKISAMANMPDIINPSNRIMAKLLHKSVIMEKRIRKRRDPALLIVRYFTYPAYSARCPENNRPITMVPQNRVRLAVAMEGDASVTFIMILGRKCTKLISTPT